MKSRTTLIIVTFILLNFLAASCALAVRDKHERDRVFEKLGTAVSINRSSGDFTLKEGRNTYQINTDRATFQSKTGRRMSWNDVVEGTTVRVVGKQSVNDTVRADMVVIVEPARKSEDYNNRYESNKSEDYNNRYESNYKTSISGSVTNVNSRARQIHVRSGSKNYVVAIDSRTDITRNSRQIMIGDIRTNEDVTVTGEIRGQGRIDAASVKVSNNWKKERSSDDWNKDRPSGDRYRTHSSMIEGSIISTTSFFDRSIAIRTYSGTVKLDVSKNADVQRDGKSASIHDFKKGDRVRAYGKWDHDTMSVTRIETYSGSYKGRNYPKYDGSQKYDSKRNSKYDVIRTGRIKSIDSRKHELTIDTGSGVVRVNANHADLQYRDKAVEFSQFEVGDRVDVRGNLDRDVLNADSIEVY